jgi:hypothetical protein
MVKLSYIPLSLVKKLKGSTIGVRFYKGLKELFTVHNPFLVDKV